MKRVPLMVRLPPDLHLRLRESAEKNDNSLNSEITRRLRASLEGYRR